MFIATPKTNTTAKMAIMISIDLTIPKFKPQKNRSQTQ
jgi:hypothetical protein